MKTLNQQTVRNFYSAILKEKLASVKKASKEELLSEIQQSPDLHKLFVGYLNGAHDASTHEEEEEQQPLTQQEEAPEPPKRKLKKGVVVAGDNLELVEHVEQKPKPKPRGKKTP